MNIFTFSYIEKFSKMASEARLTKSSLYQLFSNNRLVGIIFLKDDSVSVDSGASFISILNFIN